MSCLYKYEDEETTDIEIHLVERENIEEKMEEYRESYGNYLGKMEIYEYIEHSNSYLCK
jgi:hypothetical protein